MLVYQRVPLGNLADLTMGNPAKKKTCSKNDHLKSEDTNAPTLQLGRHHPLEVDNQTPCKEI